MVVCWPVGLSFAMDEWPHLAAHPLGVQVCEVEDLELLHDGCCVGARWFVDEQSDYLLLGSDEGL